MEALAVETRKGPLFINLAERGYRVREERAAGCTVSYCPADQREVLDETIKVAVKLSERLTVAQLLDTYRELTGRDYIGSRQKADVTTSWQVALLDRVFPYRVLPPVI